MSNNSRQAYHQRQRRETNQALRPYEFSVHPEKQRVVQQATKANYTPQNEEKVFVGVKIIDGKRYQLFKKPSELECCLG